jgi:hypothetical protein
VTSSQDYLTLTALRERGWSPSLLRRLLGAPDKTSPNPHRRSGPPMQLYSPDRVAEAEAHPDFVAYQTSRATRSAAALTVADSKRRELLHRIAEIEITIPQRPLDRLRRAALLSWQDGQAERGNYGADGADAPPDVLDRWAVNYIRHELTDYDRLLYDEIAGRIGVGEAGRLLKRRILDKIAEVYPELADEARRQKLA